MSVKKVFLIALVAVALLVPVSLAEEMSLSRLDDDGYLYYMDYTGDYYSPSVFDTLRRVGYVDPGCSSFFTHNPDGEPISCRNYDYPHHVIGDDQTLTGLNVVLHCKPEGKYESIAVADAVWCDQKDPMLRNGGPDMEGFDVAVLDMLPYQCMDGINEKGLFVSIMRLDIKEGDRPARMGVAASILLRYMLDDCANVEEVVAKVDTAFVTPEDWQGCHFFVTDADGRYMVIESRNGVVSLIENDVVTNFYLGSDDMQDSVRKGVLREKAVALVDENGETLYRFGYGHGYHRFVTLASQLVRYQDKRYEEYRTMMPEETALVMLRSALQNQYTETTGTSFTQYSVIYNNAHRTVKVWPFQNYETAYMFDVTGARLQ